VFGDCQMRISKYLVEKKAILLIFFRLFVELPAKDQPFWTTYETLAEIERVAKNDNSTLHGRWVI